MFDHIPFDIQTTILKKLPVKSLIQFRCVSKQWKSLIDSLECIKIYRMMSDRYLLARHFESIKNNKMMNDRHLLVRYNVQQYIADKDDNLSMVDEDVSCINNNAFPQHMSPIIVPLSVKALSCVRILGSSYGIICFHGYHKDYPNIDSEMVVFWTPSIRKSVSVLLEPPVRLGTSWVGFGVCPETRDPKLVKIDNVKGGPEVQVYTLSTKAWKKLYLQPPYIPRGLRYRVGVCVEQFIYWLARDDMYGSNFIVSFDLSNDEFKKMNLHDNSECLMLSKWNEYLAVFEYCDIYGNLLNYSDVNLIKNNGESTYYAPHIKLIFPKYDRLVTYNTMIKARIELRNGKAIAIVKTRYANDDDDFADPVLQVFDPWSNVSLNFRDYEIVSFRNMELFDTVVCYL